MLENSDGEKNARVLQAQDSEAIKKEDMKPIEKLDMRDYSAPRILFERGKKAKYSIVEIIDSILGKLDELVERVNILSKALNKEEKP